MVYGGLVEGSCHSDLKKVLAIFQGSGTYHKEGEWVKTHFFFSFSKLGLKIALRSGHSYVW